MKDYGHPDPSTIPENIVYTVSELDEMPKKWLESSRRGEWVSGPRGFNLPNS